jgi:hypothetical protein
VLFKYYLKISPSFMKGKFFSKIINCFNNKDIALREPYFEHWTYIWHTRGYAPSSKYTKQRPTLEYPRKIPHLQRAKNWYNSKRQSRGPL